MAGQRKGKFMILFLLIVFCCSSVPTDSEDEYDPNRVVMGPNEHEIFLLQKLDELMVSVKNIGEVVNRLESRSFESNLNLGIENDENVGLAVEEEEAIVVDEEIDEEGSIRSPKRPGAVSVVTRYNPFWSDEFQFVSAVKLNSDPTCVHVLSSRDHDHDHPRITKCIAVGDEKGVVHVFSRTGEVLVEFGTLSELPITSMLSYSSIYKNESVLITGHSNGDILMHRLWERSNGEDLNSLVMENVGKFASDVHQITNLEVHYVGRTRYILSMDEVGMIKVFKENGVLHGSVMPKSKLVAFLKQRLLFLTETGAGSLDLRSMKIRESECEGLNHSRAKSYVFDATEKNKAYGLTWDGDLFYVSLLGDIVNFKCRVRLKRKLEMKEPIEFGVIKGYLVVVDNEKVSVYNVSALHRVGGPRLLFSASLDEIKSSFLNHQSVEVDSQTRRVVPLVDTDREKLVVLGLGDGYMGMYRSNLPVFKGESSAMLWSSPVFLFIIFLFGAWHLFAKKKDALTSWGPDDPFVDPSRNADMNLRGAALRRYDGAGSSFRPSSGDPNPRLGSTADPGVRALSSFRPSYPNPRRGSGIDSNLRTGSEVKLRGSSGMESGGHAKRREQSSA